MEISVIIPYKEDRGWLQQAIESVPKDCELILSKGNGNCQQNFNNGIKRAKGDLIRWLHDDDRLTPNCIEDSVRTFQEQGCDFIHGNALNWYPAGHGRTIPYIPPVKFPTLETQLNHNVMHSATLMYRREVFEKVGYFDESLIWSEEVEFNLRCLHAGLKVGYCNSFLAYYRIHEKQKSNADQIARQQNRENIKNKYR